MSELLDRLDKVKARLSEPAFLANKGLSNEVGIHVFCYDSEDELVVQAYFDKLKKHPAAAFRIVERDLYKIFLSICEDKRILNSIPRMEESKGSEFLKAKLENIATPEAFVERMKYEPHQRGDILLISGVGKVYPFMRSHKILDNIQHIFSDIPVLMLYPGKFDGQNLDLFGRFLDGHYYRAFNLL